MVRIYNKKKLQEHEEKLVVAYLTAYWNRIKKMPSLKEILNKSSGKKKQSSEQMLEEIKRLNEAMGGTVF